jgi:hypothetical protein
MNTPEQPNIHAASVTPAAPTKAWTTRLRPYGWALLGLMLCQLG